jgi:large subunit ribosomal protein L15
LPRPGFEGGQTPLNQRISKWGFFHPKKEFDLVNLTQLEKDKKKSDNQVIDYSQKKKPVKILGNGELTESLENWTVRVAAISRSAQEKIEQVGGHVEIIKNEKSPKRAVK